MLAILFDLDGTLLDIDLETFLGRYFAALETAMQPALSGSMSGAAAMRALNASTQAMIAPHDGATNREVFHRDFQARTGIDIEASWDLFDRFYAEEFSGLQGASKGHSGASEAIETARGLGLRVAVATNPIFPKAAVLHRLAWAGLADVPFDVVTTYEIMTASKPQPEYFRQTAAMLGVPTESCIMVGDDRFLDLAAADVGMRTFYVGGHPDTHADYSGSLRDLAQLLPRLCAGAD